jgi:hypothetical protein
MVDKPNMRSRALWRDIRRETFGSPAEKTRQSSHSPLPSPYLREQVGSLYPLELHTPAFPLPSAGYSTLLGVPLTR